MRKHVLVSAALGIAFAAQPVIEAKAAAYAAQALVQERARLVEPIQLDGGRPHRYPGPHGYPGWRGHPAGAGHRSGADLLAGLADLIGMAAPGCVGPTMEPSSRASRSARSSLSLQSDMSRRARRPICAGIGPTPTETEATGTIARPRYSAAPARRLLGSLVREASIA